MRFGSGPRGRLAHARLVGVLACCLASGCQAPAAVAPATASLELHLEGLRHLQYAGEANSYKIEIAGPDLDTPFVDQLDPGKPGDPLTVKQVPIGRARFTARSAT